MAAIHPAGRAILPSLFCETKQTQEGRGRRVTSSVKNPSASITPPKKKKGKWKIIN